MTIGGWSSFSMISVRLSITSRTPTSPMAEASSRSAATPASPGPIPGYPGVSTVKPRAS
jgi:hypothetical protein